VICVVITVAGVVALSAPIPGVKVSRRVS